MRRRVVYASIVQRSFCNALLLSLALTVACGGESSEQATTSEGEVDSPARTGPSARADSARSEGPFPGGLRVGMSPSEARATLGDPTSWRRTYHSESDCPGTESWYVVDTTHLGVEGRAELHFYWEQGLGLAAFDPEDRAAYEQALQREGVALSEAPMSTASHRGVEVTRFPTGDFSWSSEGFQDEVTRRIEACVNR